jgi:hypothetical protein
MGTWPNVTIAVWVNISAASFPTTTTILDTESGSGGVRYRIYNATSHMLCVASTTNGYLPYGQCNPLLPPSTIATGWHHLLIRYASAGMDAGQGGTIDFYIDGAHNSFIPNDADNNPVFTAAMDDNLAVEGAGVSVDDLRVYNSVFSDADQCTAIIGGTWTGTTCTLPP